MAEEVIAELLNSSFRKREVFLDYQDGCRLVYGASDCLPGLIVDKYKKYILVQVNTAGLDRFRSVIRSTIKNYFEKHEVVFYDNEEYRKAEVLPTHEKESITEELEILERNTKKLSPVLTKKFPRMTYTEALFLLEKKKHMKRLQCASSKKAHLCTYKIITNVRLYITRCSQVLFL